MRILKKPVTSVAGFFYGIFASMSDEFINKVAQSGIITLNLEDYYSKQEIATFDLKDYLFMGLILKEKDFRDQLKVLDTTPYNNKIVALTCSADAIIPMWAYMLVVSSLSVVDCTVVFGTEAEVAEQILLSNIEKISPTAYDDKRIVLKGCGEKPVPASAYVALTQLLQPVAKSIMFGEPCSTVPVYKKPKP